MYVLKDSSGKVIQESKDGIFYGKLPLGQYTITEVRKPIKLGRSERRKSETLKRKKR